MFIINDLSNKKIEDYGFLNEIFIRANKLKVLDLSYCNINDWRFRHVGEDNIPERLEEFSFSGNWNMKRIDCLIRKVVERCQELKVLKLRDCNLDDKVMLNVDFNRISTQIEYIDLYNNLDLSDFTFLNCIFQRAVKLTKIYLPNNLNIRQINFSLIYKKAKILEIDKSCNSQFKTDHFKAWMHQKLEYSFDYLEFKKQYCLIQNEQSVNFHEDFQFANLTLHKYQMLGEIFNIRKYDVNITTEKKKSIQDTILFDSAKNVYSSHIHPLYFYPFFKDVLLNNPKQNEIDKEGKLDIISKQKIQKKNFDQENVYIDQQIIQAGKGIKHLGNQKMNKDNKELKYLGAEEINNLEIKQITKQEIMHKGQEIRNECQVIININQELGNEDYGIRNENEEVNQELRNEYKKIRVDEIVKEQNVFMNQEYRANNFFREEYADMIVSDKQQDIINTNANNTVTIKNKIKNIDFLPLLFEKWRNIQKIDFSGSNLYFEIQKYNNIKHPLIHLEELNVQYLKCKNDNCILIVNEIVKNSPNLRKLNVSNTGMSTERCCDFDLISSSLEELNISSNKFISLNILKNILKRCQEMRVLRINNICLQIDECDASIFCEISKKMQEMYCQNNKFNSSEQINTIIDSCQQLRILNLSDSHITDDTNENIHYHNISQSLTHLDMSKNQINQTFNSFFLLSTRCPHLQSFDITYQANFYDDSLSHLLLTLPRNLSHLIKTNIQNQLNVLLIQKINKIHQIQYKQEKLKEDEEEEIKNHDKMKTDENLNKIEDIDKSKNDEIDKIQDNEIDKNYDEINKSKDNEIDKIEDQIDKSKEDEIDKSQDGDVYICRKRIYYHFNKYKATKEWKMESIEKRICEIDISNNYDLNEIHIDCINKTRDNRNLQIFNGHGCNLTDRLIQQLEIDKLFVNLKQLDISSNYNIKSLSFLNQLFQTATHLQQLNLSNLQMTQERVSKIDFSLLPHSLKYLDLSLNYRIQHFTFLNDVFQATSHSLTHLLLQECDLNTDKLQSVNFSLISSQIRCLDFSKNQNLQSINFLNSLFDRYSNFILENLLLTETSSCELFSFLAQYQQRVTYLKYDINQFNCNSTSNYYLNANLEQLFYSSQFSSSKFYYSPIRQNYAIPQILVNYSPVVELGIKNSSVKNYLLQQLYKKIWWVIINEELQYSFIYFQVD